MINDAPQGLEAVAAPEGSFEVVTGLGGLITLGITLSLLYRFTRVWVAFRRCLVALSETPLITAFERLPQRVARRISLMLLDVPSPDIVDAVARTQWSHLRRLYQPTAKEFVALRKQDAILAGRIDALMRARPRSGRRSDDYLNGQYGEMLRVLEALWFAEPGLGDLKKVAPLLPPQGGSDPMFRSTSGAFRRTFADPVRLWLRELEEFTCVQIVIYIEWVLDQLRGLAIALLAAVVLMICFVTAYPLRPLLGLQLPALTLLAGTAVVVILTVLQMSRDDVLSRITKTAPGHVTFDASLIMNVLVYGGIPLLLVMAGHFPMVREIVSQWLQPLVGLVTGRG